MPSHPCQEVPSDIPSIPIIQSTSDNNKDESSSVWITNTSSHNLYSTGAKDNNQDKISLERHPPQLTKEEWEDINNEFMELNRMSWEKVKNHDEEPEKFISELNNTLAQFLQSKPQFQHDAKTFNKHPVKSADTLEELRKKKNNLN